MKKLITICAVVGMLLTASADVKGVPVDTRLLLHFDVIDGATTTVDSSPQNHTPINFFGDAQLDTAEKYAGTASLLLDGTDDYLTIADSPDWDLLASATDSWTIDFWVRHNSPSDYEIYLQQYGAGLDRWWIGYQQTVGLKFGSYCGPDLPPAGVITDNEWHWITFCKVADEYGMYKDSQQISYKESNGTGNFTSPLYIGGYSSAGYSLNGRIDELRITHDNLFGANPNAGLTDTITYVPEPTTIVLLGLGGLALLRRRKK